MYTEEKVWSIEIGDDLEVTQKDGEHREPSDPPSRPDRARSLVVRRVRAGRTAPDAKAVRRLPFVLLLPLVYLTGPFAVFLTPEGRRRKDWMVTATIVGLGWIAAAIWHARLLAWVAGDVARGPILLVLGSLLVGGFSVWARAVLDAGGPNRPVTRKLPLPLRRAWGVGLLGLMAPGAGLLAAGRTRRAAAALWLAWIPLAAALYLDFALRAAPVGGQGPTMEFERALLVAGALAAGGLIGWMVQALEGARLAPREEGRSGRRRGDLLGLAAVAGMLALMTVVDPSPVARELGRQARSLQAAGYRHIPLAMVRTAAVLDPARTDYAVTALEILRELGREEPATELRQRIENDLAPYLAMVRREALARERARRAAARAEAARTAVLPGWFEPLPHPVMAKDPEEGSSGSR